MSSYFLNCNFNESSEIIVSVCTIQGISGKVQSSLGGRENRYKILWYLFRESQRTPSVSIMWCDSSRTEHHLKSEPSSSFKKLDKFLQICQNCTIILLFAPENTEMKTISLIMHYYPLCAISVVLNQGNFAPQRTLAICGDIFDYHNSGWWGGLPPASRW